MDDDTALTSSLGQYLALHQIDTDAVSDTHAAASALRDLDYDTILLDVMLPDQTGFDFLPELRRMTDAPVFMLSAMGEESQRVNGLNLGADDYITKPFSAKELVARLRATQRRRCRDQEQRQSWVHDDISLHPQQHVVVVGGTQVNLTGVETQILQILMEATTSAVSRESLSRMVLGRDASPLDRSLDVHVSNLRRKMGEHPQHGNRIRSVRGRGYVLVR